MLIPNVHVLIAGFSVVHPSAFESAKMALLSIFIFTPLFLFTLVIYTTYYISHIAINQINIAFYETLLLYC